MKLFEITKERLYLIDGTYHRNIQYERVWSNWIENSFFSFGLYFNIINILFFIFQVFNIMNKKAFFNKCFQNRLYFFIFFEKKFQYYLYKMAIELKKTYFWKISKRSKNICDNFQFVDRLIFLAKLYKDKIFCFLQL